MTATPLHQIEPGTADWHAERAKGIGGSEWADVLYLEPYGCGRKLWYEKRGQPPDFGQPKEPEGYLVRGQAMEQLVADEVAEDWGRMVRRVGRLAQSDLPSWWIGNPDRMIASSGPDDPQGPGILEIKTMNPWLFRRLKRDGAKLYHLAQVHHYLGLTGWKWGLLRVKEPVSWENYDAIVTRDEDLLEQMEAAGNIFWHRTQNAESEGPDPLDAKDARCADCPFRWTCQGEALIGGGTQPKGEIEEWQDPEFATLVEQEREIAAIEKEAGEERKKLQERIKEALADPRKVQTSLGRRVYWIESIVNRLDQRALKSAHPQLAAEFTKPNPQRTLRIY